MKMTQRLPPSIRLAMEKCRMSSCGKWSLFSVTPLLPFGKQSLHSSQHDFERVCDGLPWFQDPMRFGGREDVGQSTRVRSGRLDRHHVALTIPGRILVEMHLL